jgi:nicotinamidase-related amidase
VLIVVDIANAFTDPASALSSNLNPQVKSINRLLDAAHAKGVPVIFTPVWYEQSDLSDAGIWAGKQKGVQFLRAGTPMVELDARLRRKASCQWGFRPMVVRSGRRPVEGRARAEPVRPALALCRCRGARGDASVFRTGELLT